MMKRGYRRAMAFGVLFGGHAWWKATQGAKKNFQDAPYEFLSLFGLFVILRSGINNARNASDIACLTKSSFSPDGRLNMCHIL